LRRELGWQASPRPMPLTFQRPLNPIEKGAYGRFVSQRV
jgi:hypothetical protein